jgi:hypothetical protein
MKKVSCKKVLVMRKKYMLYTPDIRKGNGTIYCKSTVTQKIYMTLCKLLGLFHSQKLDFCNFNISKIYRF